MYLYDVRTQRAFTLMGGNHNISNLIDLIARIPPDRRYAFHTRFVRITQHLYFECIVDSLHPQPEFQNEL